MLCSLFDKEAFPKGVKFLEMMMKISQKGEASGRLTPYLSEE